MKKKVLCLGVLLCCLVFNISAAPHENWEQWNVTYFDYSDLSTKNNLTKAVSNSIDILLSSNMKIDKLNYKETNFLYSEEKRDAFEKAYVYTLVYWYDYLKLSLCEADGLESLSDDEIKEYDNSFYKLNRFSTDFLAGDYTDGLSPLEYEFFRPKDFVRRITVSLDDMRKHIDLDNYLENPDTIPRLSSLKQPTLNDKESNNHSEENIVKTYTAKKNNVDPFLIFSIIFPILLILLEVFLGRIETKPLIRSLLFGLIVIAFTNLGFAVDGEYMFFDDDALPWIALTGFLFSLITYPMYRSIRKHKKNNKSTKFAYKKSKGDYKPKLAFYRTVNDLEKKRYNESAEFVYKEKKNAYKTKLEFPKRKIKVGKSISVNLKKSYIYAGIALILGPLSLICSIFLRIIYNKKRNQCESLSVYKKIEIISRCFLIIQSVEFLCFFICRIFLYFYYLPTILWIVSGITGFLSISLTYDYIDLLFSIIKNIESKEFIDLSNTYRLKPSDCNSILYEKKRKIDENYFNIKQQIVLSYTLHQINEANAIGIQQLSKFYFLNLKIIFNTFDEKVDPEYRELIIQNIERSYGNDKLDKEDWAIGASIGLLSGLIDIFFVGKPGESKFQNIADKTEERCVMYAAKLIGYNGNELAGAVRFLEKKYWVAYDKTKINEIGMTEDNHHLQSLAHSNDIIGIIFAILDTKLSIEKSIENNGNIYTVVTCAYSKDPETIKKIEESPNLEFIFGGMLVRLIEPLTIQSGDRKGEEKTVDNLAKSVLYRIIYEKCKEADETKRTIIYIVCGFFLWLGHLFSDRIGSSSTVEKGNRGSGITVPFQELFANVNIEFENKLLKSGKEKFEKKLTEISKKMFEEGFDNRFFTTQKIPVLINEYLTKIIFIIKEYLKYDKVFDTKEIIQILLPEGNIKSMGQMHYSTANFELDKTLLVSYSVFSTVDVSSAFVTSKAESIFMPNLDTLLSINYPGLIKLGKESVSVLLSYLRRWTTSPERLIEQIRKLAIEYNAKDSEKLIESN